MFHRRGERAPLILCVCVCVLRVSRCLARQYSTEERGGMHNAMREVIAEHREKLSGLLIQGETGRLLSCPMRSWEYREDEQGKRDDDDKNPKKQAYGESFKQWSRRKIKKKKGLFTLSVCVCVCKCTCVCKKDKVCFVCVSLERTSEFSKVERESQYIVFPL